MLQFVSFMADQDPKFLTEPNQAGSVTAHAAAELGCIATLKYIKEKAEDTLHVKNNDDGEPLRLAMYGVQGPTQQREALCIWFFQCYPLLMKKTYDAGMRWIHCATIANLAEVIRFLTVNEKGSVNVPDQRGLTPLHYAAWDPLMRGILALKTLLESGGDTSVVNEVGMTPLGMAALHHNHAARDCLQSWNNMRDDQRNVIRTFGWDYFNMPTWSLHVHSEFPLQLRAQVFAVAVSVGDLAPVLDLVAKGLDALKRRRKLVI